MMYNIPVLFLIFNRPDTTAQVFERIRQIKPARLYVAADAAREGRPDETQRCAEARAIIDGIDWDCELAYMGMGIKKQFAFQPKKWATG